MDEMSTLQRTRVAVDKGKGLNQAGKCSFTAAEADVGRILYLDFHAMRFP